MADRLLAKVAIYDAKNTEVLDPSLAEAVSHQIEKAEQEPVKANEELQQGRPDKAIARLGEAWLHAQLAIRFAASETST